MGRAADGAIARAFQFGYDFVAPKGRRRAPSGVLRSEDQELNPTERRKMVSGARETHRNFTIAQWAIRKHLDYVSSFNFQSKIGNEADQQLETLMRDWSAKGACDAGGRHSLARLVRMMEARRTIDGDVFLLRLAGGTLQPIEGDRVQTPVGGIPGGKAASDPARLIHGVQLDAAGRAAAYAVCRRVQTSDFSPSAGSFEFERLVSAANLYQHAWYERFDQVRGISPMAPALNTLQDLYEGFDYALAKMKISQLFGLIFYREQADRLAPTEATDEDGTGYEVDFGKGPVTLTLDPGDKAQWLESKTPSTEFQTFSQTMISVALKALDIPYSMFAENFTNYSGARQALLQYQLSCELKRADVADLLNWITAWRTLLWIEAGELDVRPEDVKWEWVAKGIAWIDPLKEVQADVQAIGAGLYSRTRVLREQGLDFREVIDELAAEVEYMKSKGLDPSVNASPNIVTLEQAA